MIEKPIDLESVVRCPRCGSEEKEYMPVDSCLIAYTCKRCGAILHPEQGDCCVFCSYGSRPCLPMQGVKG